MECAGPFQTAVPAIRPPLLSRVPAAD